MPLPPKLVKNLPLTSSKILVERRRELLDKINKDGTYLPKSILHSDLDGGFLSFVKNDLKLSVTGKIVPVVDIIITTQNWSQFVETWDIQNIDKNVEPPLITVVRVPEVKFGNNPAIIFNIPNRKQFYYAQVPNWDGQRVGVDVYKIPQPVPVDITYQVKLVCNRMRELNSFNKVILEKFSSKQAYTQIKGHYIPITMGAISDESVLDVEKRKYYIQSYEFTLLGFLLDEEEFEISPGITRVLKVLEVDKKNINKSKNLISRSTTTPKQILFVEGVDTITQLYDYTTNLILGNTQNINSYDVYINNNYFGSDLSEIQLNSGDVLRITIIKINSGSESKIDLLSNLI
jgi:hypothetical protein